MTQVFLSHATSDAVLVGEACARLGKLGVTVYTAEHDNQAGDNTHAKIQAAVSESDIIAVLLTDGGYDSRYVHQEIGFGLGQGKLVIPIVTFDTKKLDLGMLQGVEYIEVDELDPAAALERLDERVADLVLHQQQRHEDEDVRRRQQKQDALLLVGAATVLLLVLIGNNA
jgi:hypothetical protein